MRIPLTGATKPQVKFIEQLSIDLGFDIKRRDAHIKSIVGRSAKPDELTIGEASQVIDQFKEWKEK